jgi:hypothetical protein
MIYFFTKFADIFIITSANHPEEFMADQSCENCAFRAKYDANPKSLLGRIWRWHANWCPGWKAYMNGLEEQDRTALAQKYNMNKFIHA